MPITSITIHCNAKQTAPYECFLLRHSSTWEERQPGEFLVSLPVGTTIEPVLGLEKRKKVTFPDGASFFWFFFEPEHKEMMLLPIEYEEPLQTLTIHGPFNAVGQCVRFCAEHGVAWVRDSDAFHLTFPEGTTSCEQMEESLIPGTRSHLITLPDRAHVRWYQGRQENTLALPASSFLHASQKRIAGFF